MVNKTGQSEIFNPVGFDSQFAELCNALYAAELIKLSDVDSNDAHSEDIRLLRRRLGSLSYYVQRAAHALLVTATRTKPMLQLDVHSGNWLAKQKTTPPISMVATDALPSTTDNQLSEWLVKHAKLALALPVYVESAGIVIIALDSIDEVNMQERRLHLNQWGWFNFEGESSENSHLRLIKPDRATMTAACCGHQWNAKGRMQPYNLNLRTKLLTTTLMWPKFTVVGKLPF